MRILVTDVSGVLGRAVARQLVAAGYRVSGMARHPHDQLGRGVDLVCGPLGGPVLQRLADAAHVVIHLAPIDPGAPGRAGINGVVQVAHAAARAGARLVFVSQAAGEPALYRQAERLVSTGWAPSLIIRSAPPVGGQLDWAVCRTVAAVLRAKASPRPLRLLHLDDLIRFLLLAVTTDATGVVDLAAPGTVDLPAARRLLRSVAQRPRRTPQWASLVPDLDLSTLQRDWQFGFGWSAGDGVADTARGLVGRRLAGGGAVALSGRVPLPLESPPWCAPSDGVQLHCAAPDGLEGEYDDRIDPRFPVFSAASLAETLPGPLTPMTLDVQLTGLRMACRVIARVMALGEVLTTEWGSRAIAVFGHRPYVGVSAGTLAARRLPGWDERAVIGTCPAGAQVREPSGRTPLTGLPGSAAKAAAATRALVMLRHLNADTQRYTDAAAAEHLDPTQLSSLSGAALQVRIRLMKARIQQGWSLTALWLIDTGITAATLQRTAAHAPVRGLHVLLESGRAPAAIAELAGLLHRDPRVAALAERGDLAGIRGLAPGTAAEIDSVVARVAHRGRGDAELANPVFGDDPATLLVTASALPAPGADETPAGTLAERLAANARASRESAHDATLRFTHELRMLLRECGSRQVAADLIDTAEDVYYLTCDELLVMPGDARLRIKRRRAERERLQALRLPDVIDGRWQPLETAANG